MSHTQTPGVEVSQLATVCETLTDRFYGMGNGASTFSSSYENSKSQGDAAHRAGSHSEAIYWYSHALSAFNNYLELSTTSSTDQDSNIHPSESEVTKMVAILFSNRSLSFLENGQPTAALQDAIKATQVNPQWAKGYYRAGSASFQLKRIREAKSYLTTARLLSPSDSSIIKLLHEVDSCDAQVSLDDTQRRINLVDGNIYSWGKGLNGQLGLGLPLADKAVPTAMSFLLGKSIQDISCGFMHSAAVTESGEIYTWGSNEHKQLGSSSENNDVIVPTPMLISKLFGLKVTAVSCGAGHSVALIDTGAAFAWGIGNHGQLGCGPTVNMAEEPIRVTFASENCKVISVNCGISHTIFLTSDGRLKACGNNSYGQLSTIRPNDDRRLANSIQSSNNFTFVPSDCYFDSEAVSYPLSHVACGGAHTVVIDAEGFVYSCGSNSCGQLGLGSFVDVFVLTRIKDFFGDSLGAFCACGEEYTAFVTRERKVYTCGLGLAGQLGLDDLEPKMSPTNIESLNDVGVETIVCSHSHVYAISKSGEVWTWGLIECGFVHNGPSAIKLPSKMNSWSSKRKIKQISCGRSHVIMLVLRPYAPLCYAVTGLEAYPAIIDAVAGRLIKFVIQAKDENDEMCDKGGCKFNTEIVHENINYEIKFRQQITDEAQRSKHGCVIDDNFDGTYSGTCRLLLAGLYRLTVTLDNIAIKNSPFEIAVNADSICASRSYCWWGKYAVKGDALSSGITSGYGVNLACQDRDALLFTVSGFDQYGNKCDDTGDSAVFIAVVKNAACSQDNLQSSCNEETRIVCSDSTSGLFPCSFRSPSVEGDYRVYAHIISLGRHRIDEYEFLSQKHVNNNVQGSPFPLHVTASTDSVSIEACISSQADAGNEPCIEGSSLQVENPRAVELTKMESTRLRAEAALLRLQRTQRLAIEEARRKKQVRRTGGGFVIQYSKEV